MSDAPGQPARRGPIPTSATVRKKLLHDMLVRAQSGSAAHAEALVRLSLEAERAAREVEHRGARAA
jgi:hypothetical protein